MPNRAFRILAVMGLIIGAACQAAGPAGTDGGGGSGAGGATGSGGSGGCGDCGGRACAAGELCVRPSCGGAPPLCQPVPDGGQCPAGWTPIASCPLNGFQGPACTPPPCTPPAPYCVAPPASCGSAPSCSCLPGDVCRGGGACGLISGGELLCVSA